MNVFKYIGNDYENLNFEKGENYIITQLQKKEVISKDSLRYLILNSIMYDYKNALKTIENNYKQEYNEFMKKNSMYLDIFSSNI